MLRSEIDCAGRVNVNGQPTAICIDFAAKSIEREQYARVGLALLLHIQRWSAFKFGSREFASILSRGKRHISQIVMLSPLP
jgi:hypothetical protein